MDLTAFLAATLAVAIGSIVQAASGVGAGFIMAPMLALIDLRLVPGPLIFGSLALSGIMTWRERGAIDMAHLPAIIAGLVPGCLLGGWLLTSVPASSLGVVFGSVILIAIAISSSRLAVPLSRPSAIAAALVAGAMGTSSGIGAPPLALLYQGQSGARARSTLALIYTLASLLIILTLIIFDAFGRDELIDGVLLVPGFLLGYLASRRLTQRIDGRGTRIAILGVSAAAAIALIARSLG